MSLLDIVTTGTTEEEHIRNLEQVLCRLLEAGVHLKKEKCVFFASQVEYPGVHLKKEKCVFFASQVEYPGHLINKEGLHPSPSKSKL